LSNLDKIEEWAEEQGFYAKPGLPKSQSYMLMLEGARAFVKWMESKEKEVKTEE
jgi:hypothetical protein